MSPLSALIFDVDGTLADTERDAHRVAFNRAFEDAGWDFSWDVETYGQLLQVTGGKERIRHYLSLHPELPFADEAAIAAIHEAKTAYYVDILAKGEVPLRPGVLRLLTEARQSGLRLAIATTTTLENVLALLRHSVGPEALAWFDTIEAGDVVPNKKPAPDIYLRALEHLNLPADACLAIEDSRNGLDAAQAAGLATLITTNGYTRHQQFPGALAVLEHLGEPDRPANVLTGPEPGPLWVTVPRLQHWQARREATR